MIVKPNREVKVAEQTSDVALSKLKTDPMQDSFQLSKISGDSLKANFDQNLANVSAFTSTVKGGGLLKRIWETLKAWLNFGLTKLQKAEVMLNQAVIEMKDAMGSLNKAQVLALAQVRNAEDQIKGAKDDYKKYRSQAKKVLEANGGDKTDPMVIRLGQQAVKAKKQIETGREKLKTAEVYYAKIEKNASAVQMAFNAKIDKIKETIERAKASESAAQVAAIMNKVESQYGQYNGALEELNAKINENEAALDIAMENSNVLLDYEVDQIDQQSQVDDFLDSL